MNFSDLECFLAAAEEKSFTRAANRLYISQQSLSAHILKLEKHYQAKFTIDRKGFFRVWTSDPSDIKQKRAERGSQRRTHVI